MTTEAPTLFDSPPVNETVAEIARDAGRYREMLRAKRYGDARKMAESVASRYDATPGSAHAAFGVVSNTNSEEGSPRPSSLSVRDHALAALTVQLWMASLTHETLPHTNV